MGPNDESPCELAPQPGLKPEKILDFSIPVNPLGPSKRAERKVIKGFSAAFRYPEARGGDLIKTLAQFHGIIRRRNSSRGRGDNAHSFHPPGASRPAGLDGYPPFRRI